MNFRGYSGGEGLKLTSEISGNGHSSTVIRPLGDCSDGEEDEVESILVDHSKFSWWNIFTLCKRVFRSHRFRNVQAEVLYQRYFLRKNQNNMASLLGLLIVISVTMIVVNHISFLPNFETMKESNEVLLGKSNITLKNVYLADNVTVGDYGEGIALPAATSYGGIVQAVILGVLAFMYLFLLIKMTRTSLNEVYLIIFSYIILASFLGIEVCLNGEKCDQSLI